MPALYHPDEPAHVRQALAVGRGLEGGLTFANPPLYKYILLAEFGADFALGRLRGVYSGPRDFVDQFRADPSHLYLIGRATSAVLGALTVLATYALAAALGGRRLGLLAGWWMAIAYLLVRDSHFAVNDALVTLLSTLALWGCARVAQSGSRPASMLAGVATGLAFAAKYQAAALLLPLVLAHAWRRERRERRLTELWLALGVALIAALVAFPSLVLEPGRVLGDVYLHLYARAQIPNDGLDPAGGYAFYLKALGLGLGWPILLAATAGLALALVRRDRPLLVVAVLPLALYLVLGYERMFYARFILPALPPLVVLAAVAVDRLLRRWSPLALAAIGLVLALVPLASDLRFDQLLTRDDTRTLASRWIESQLPPDASIAVEDAPLGPSVPADGRQVLVASDRRLYDLPLDEYRRRGIRYLVTSSFVSDAWLVDPAHDALRQAFTASLRAQAVVVAEFRPASGDQQVDFVYDQIYAPFDQLERLERPGPTVTIYRLGD